MKRRPRRTTVAWPKRKPWVKVQAAGPEVGTRRVDMVLLDDVDV
jgi:hypothetical protein